MPIPNLIFMAQPPPEVVSRLQQALAGQGLDRKLGHDLFAPTNWHQSLSTQLPGQSSERLLQAGALIHAQAFTMAFDRIAGAGTAAGSEKIHWAFHGRGRPAAFGALQKAVRASVQAVGLGEMPGNSPHITISYWAREALPTVHIRPVFWRIDEVLLVDGGGAPYHYEVIGRWPLQAAPGGQERQLQLF